MTLWLLKSKYNDLALKYTDQPDGPSGPLEEIYRGGELKCRKIPLIVRPSTPAFFRAVLIAECISFANFNSISFWFVSGSAILYPKDIVFVLHQHHIYTNASIERWNREQLQQETNYKFASFSQFWSVSHHLSKVDKIRFLSLSEL